MVSHLDKLADGVKLHLADPNFPGSLTEDDFRKARQELEDRRQAYEEATNKAHQAYVLYKETLKNMKSKVANSNTMLYGFFGKKSPLLADFGLATYKNTGVRGPRQTKKE
jgi:hypothetical protein